MATTARIRNWSEYNRALVNRGSLLFDFAPDYLTQLTYQGTQVRGGMVRYSAQMYEFLLTIKVLLRLPWRASVGFAHGLLSKAFPEATVSVPHYAHASRMAAQLPLKIKTLGLTATQGLVLAFDSTGVHVYTGSGWHQRKYGKTAKCKRRDSWKKIHLGLDLTTQQIVAMAYTDSNHNDCEMIPQLGQASTGKVTEFIADGAYDTRACYQMTTRWQAKAIIPPDCRAKMQVQLKSPRTYQSYLAQRDQTLQEIQRSHTRIKTMESAPPLSSSFTN